MKLSHIDTVQKLEGLLNSINEMSLEKLPKKEIYDSLRELLLGLKYRKLKKKDKQVVLKFIKKITQYSDRQIKRLIKKYKDGTLYWNQIKPNPSARYTRQDIELLHKVDQAHKKLSGTTIKKIIEREVNVFDKEEYTNLANISVPHIYNLRGSVTYERLGLSFTKTNSKKEPQIGIRKKPQPNGKPGFFRVDSVHLGDQGKKKGIYFINMIDETIQLEFVFCVPQICDKYMIPVLQKLYELSPITIINFHSDNGSEYINYKVKDLLNRLHTKQTKSRSRKHNDNALVESKNGSVIRKYFGYTYIPATEFNANLINDFCVNWLNPYLNYHHPCAFAVVEADKKGKQRKKYPLDKYLTPYEKLKSIQNSEKYLKQAISFDQLDKIAYNNSDTEFAELLNQAQELMYSNLIF